VKIAPANRRRVGLLVGLGAALVLYLLIRRSGGGTDEALELAAAAGPAPASAFDTGSAVGTGAELTSFVQATEERLAQQEQLIENFGLAVNDFKGRVVELEDVVQAGFDQLSQPPAIDPDWFPPTDEGPSGQTQPTAPGNAKAAGFWWNVGGKRTRVTTQNTAAFLRELRAKGVDPRVWAERHPAAAQAVGLWPPSSIPKPKKKPKSRPPRGGGRGGRGGGSRPYVAPSSRSSSSYRPPISLSRLTRSVVGLAPRAAVSSPSRVVRPTTPIRLPSFSSGGRLRME